MQPDIKTMFYNYVAGVIDQEGVYPYPAMWHTVDPNLLKDGCPPEEALRLNVAALDLKPHQVVLHLLKQRLESATELIYGIDRTTKEGQGTTLSDVLTCGYWSQTTGWQIGVIEYNVSNQGKTVLPWNWNNQFWTELVMQEIEHYERTVKTLSLKLAHAKAIQRQELNRPLLDPPTLERYEAKFQADLQENPPEQTAPPYLNLRDIYFAGYWLADRLTELNAPQHEIYDACQVQGQRSFLFNPWKAAQLVLDNYKKGVKETPGEQLAQQIMLEEIISLDDLNPTQAIRFNLRDLDS